jgi:hypothetical protein
MTEERRPEETALDLPRLLRTLDAHKVEYIIIGGIAATAHGSPSFTDDLDICYQRSKPNTRALARALHAVGAVLHDGTQIITRDVLPRALELGNFFLFWTGAGKLDCLAAPDGTAGFDDLVQNAELIEYEGIRVRVTSLDDLIRMKRAVARPKDRVELEILGALREERRQLRSADAPEAPEQLHYRSSFISGCFRGSRP